MDVVLQLCSWCFFFFFEWLLASSKVFNLSSCTCEKLRNRKQERTRKSFETCFGLALPSSSTFVIVGWQRCNNTNSLQQAPSNKLPSVASTTTTLVTKRNSRIQHQKKFVPFNIKQQK
jgi:hypothetical protein